MSKLKIIQTPKDYLFTVINFHELKTTRIFAKLQIDKKSFKKECKQVCNRTLNLNLHILKVLDSFRFTTFSNLIYFKTYNNLGLPSRFWFENEGL